LLAACTNAQNGVQTIPSSATSGPAVSAQRVREQQGTTIASAGYTITDLGAVAGDAASEVGQGSMSNGKGLNNLGQAAGASESPATIATLFSSGHATSINTLGASVSFATSINDAGQIAGEETQSNDPCLCFHAFLYGNGAMKNIENTSLFPGGTEAYGINKSGQVVGTGFPAGGGSTFHAFLYSGGTMVDLNPFNGYQSIAKSINDSGQIIGSSTGDGTRANPGASTWLYSNGKITNISGSSENGGVYINNNGQIAGENNAGHGALYKNGSWTDLGGLSGASTSAVGVNLSGQAVGTAIFPIKSYHPFVPGKHVAVIFTSGSVVDLNTLIPANSGFTLTDARAINDSGQIAVVAKNSAGKARAVLLTPK
jgi:probable HAF family extracellular repeat protein